MMRVHVDDGKPAMLALVRHFYQLLILQRRPQDFPASPFLLGLVLAAYLLMGFLNNLSVSDEMTYSLLRSLLAAGLVITGTFVVLAFSGQPHRWLQASIALLGGEAMIGFMSLPFLYIVTLGINNIFLESSLLLFLVWQIAFAGHVWRHALDTNMLFGVAIAFGLIVGYSWIKISLLPFPGDA